MYRRFLLIFSAVLMIGLVSCKTPSPHPTPPVTPPPIDNPIEDPIIPPVEDPNDLTPNHDGENWKGAEYE